MMRLKVLRIALVLSVLATVLSSRSALALGAAPNAANPPQGIGHPCLVQYIPAAWDNTHGQYGFVYVTLYSGSSCKGTFIGEWNLCSTGAPTDAHNPQGCSQWQYSEAQLNVIFQTLLQAMHSNFKVVIDTFLGGATQVQFTAK